MNKEEILESVSDEMKDCYQFGNHLDIFDGQASTVFKAMDIYAKQEAIEFSLFFNRNFQTYMGSPIYFMRQYTLEELKNMTEWPDIEKVQKFTIEMIYNLFLEQR